MDARCGGDAVTHETPNNRPKPREYQISKPKSIYLTDRAMSALRSGDALSGRMNQIVDRYLLMVQLDGDRVRGMFTPAQWGTLLGSFPTSGVTASMMRDALIDGPVNDLDGGDFVTLLELLEGDRIGRELVRQV